MLQQHVVFSGCLQRLEQHASHRSCRRREHHPLHGAWPWEEDAECAVQIPFQKETVCSGIPVITAPLMGGLRRSEKGC